MMSEENLSLNQLLAARSEVLSSGSNWQDYDDAQCEDAMTRLTHIQETIVRLPLTDMESKLAALNALLDSNDQPGFADNFKNRLFEALRSYTDTGKHL